MREAYGELRVESNKRWFARYFDIWFIVAARPVERLAKPMRSDDGLHDLLVAGVTLSLERAQALTDSVVAP